LDNQKGNQSEALLHGCLGQLYSLKRYRNLKVLLSIGGATYSSNFAGPASSEQGRALFASSAVSLVKSLGLDGLDINWEYPNNDAQAADLVSLLGEIRKQLDQYGNSLGTKYHFELTFAAPAGPSNYQKLNLAAMDEYLDFWNLMAYDYTGNWTTPKITGHQANLFSAGDRSTPFNTKSSVDYYTSHGVSSEKIVLGMPMYGRSFIKTKGLGQSFESIGDGTWEKGVYDFKSLPLDGANEVYDEKLGASYSWDAAKQELISYDTVKVGRQKAKWIEDMNLGGAMWWESSSDKKGGESLIENVVRVLGGCLQQAPNNVGFPDSPYANIRSPPASQLPFSTASASSAYSSPSESKLPSEMGTSSSPVSDPASPSESATSPGSSTTGISELDSSCDSASSTLHESPPTPSTCPSIVYTTTYTTTTLPFYTTIVTVVYATPR
jgi:chitinase